MILYSNMIWQIVCRVKHEPNYLYADEQGRHWCVKVDLWRTHRLMSVLWVLHAAAYSYSHSNSPTQARPPQGSLSLRLCYENLLLFILTMSIKCIYICIWVCIVSWTLPTKQWVAFTALNSILLWRCLLVRSEQQPTLKELQRREENSREPVCLGRAWSASAGHLFKECLTLSASGEHYPPEWSCHIGRQEIHGLTIKDVVPPCIDFCSKTLHELLSSVELWNHFFS